MSALPGAAAQVPLAVIAAVPRNRVVGRDNQLVWRHPEDLKRFRALTLGCPVVMGRRTWDSLPPKFRPLPGRPNLVVTRQAGWSAEGAETQPGVEAALERARALAAASQAPRIALIGGGELWAQVLPLADELWLTEVQAEFDGDVRFPQVDFGEFIELQRLPHPHESPPFDFVHWRRRSAAR